MIAGTIGLLEEPVDEPLESWFRGGGLPALEVERTQGSFDDRPVQQGVAATRVSTVHEDVSVGIDANGDPVAIDIDRVEGTKTLTTKWVADVTGSGLIAAESVDGDSGLAFPFGLFWDRTGQQVERPQIDVEALHQAWSDEDVLGDVWMVGADDGAGAEIAYHEAADEQARPTIGLGFSRPWNGTGFGGVVYASGYVAIHNTSHPTRFARFVESELLPFAFVPDENDTEQTTLGETNETCVECGRETDLDDEGRCIVCQDAADEEEFADRVGEYLDEQGIDADRGGEA